MGKDTAQRDVSPQRDGGSYSLISVDAAPEEDVFVVNAEGVFKVDSGDDAPRCRVSDDSADADADADGDVDADSDNEQPAPSDSSSRGPESKEGPSSEVHEQTLADLEGSGPLPAMHRAIIVVLVLAAIAAVAWFFLK